MTEKRKSTSKKIINFQNLMKIGRFDKAVIIIEELILENPTNIKLIYQSAFAYVKLGNYFKAYEKMESILQEYSMEGEFLSDFGIVCMKLSLFDKAEYLFKFAIKANQNNVSYILNLAALYNKLEKYNQAINYIRSAIEINPLNKQIYTSLGVTLVKIGENSAARDAFQISLSIDPDCSDSLYNIAAIEYRDKNYELALNLFEKLLFKQSQIKSDALLDSIKFSLSMLYLYYGRLKEGWEYFDFGFHPNISPEYRRMPTRNFIKPLWDGISINDKKILIWREQGVGDEILFLSCLPDLIATDANIIIECDKRLVSILQRSFPNCIVRKEDFDSSSNIIGKYDDYDFQLPVGSLMRFFRPHIDDFSRSNKYIKVDSFLASKYKDILQKKSSHLKFIGICWRSGYQNFERSTEYTKLIDWGPIFSIKNVQFVNLQYDECEQELVQAESMFGVKIMRWKDLDLKNDFESTMALMSNLDLIVTVGTAVSSMAASIGIQVFLMEHKGWPNLGTDRYPWYKNITCFFPKSQEVNSCIPEVASAIDQMIHT